MAAPTLIQDLDEALGLQDADQFPLAVGSTGMRKLSFATLRTALASTVANALASLLGQTQAARDEAGTHAAAAQQAAAQSGSASAAAAAESAASAISAADVATSKATEAQSAALAAVAAAAVAAPPEAGVPVSTGGGWGPSKAVPAGAFVGTTDAQTLTSKSINFADNTLIGVAPLESPEFSGAPKAPTPMPGANDERIANTAFVAAAIAALLDSAPETLDTLNELASALANDPNFATTMTNALAAKAPLVSPAFAGAPTAPTPEPGSNDTRLATAEFVAAALSGIDLAGYAPLASPTLTGTPLSTTPNAADSSTKIATTAFVNAFLAAKKSVGATGGMLVERNLQGTISVNAVWENVLTVTTAASQAIRINEGGLQQWTLGQNLNVSDSLQAGQRCKVMIARGSFTVTWPTVKWVGGSAPTLPTSGFGVIEFWKIGTNLYGDYAGSVA